MTSGELMTCRSAPSLVTMWTIGGVGLVKIPWRSIRAVTSRFTFSSLARGKRARISERA